MGTKLFHHVSATESYYFVRTTPYIYQYASVRLDRQAAFRSSTVWYVRAGKGLIRNAITQSLLKSDTYQMSSIKIDALMHLIHNTFYHTK